MPIYDPADLAQLTPSNMSEAAARAAADFLCGAAPLVAAYGGATGNLPAVAGATAFSFWCGNLPNGLPLPPIPSMPSGIGGQCPGTTYRIRVSGTRSTDACTPGAPVDAVATGRGPWRITYSFFQNYSVPCRESAIGGYSGILVDGDNNQTPLGLFFLALGDYATFVATPLDGADNCGNPPPPEGQPWQAYPLPPGYPENPELPGDSGDVIVYTDPYDPNKPSGRLPWTIPSIPLPVVIPIAPVIAPNISVPISIPVSFPITGNFDIQPTVNVQIGSSGEIRTPPDLLCPCDYEPENPAGGGGGSPLTMMVDIPFYACGENPGFDSRLVQAIASSVPSDLSDKLLSSANLAEIGCESLYPPQVEPSSLSSGRVDGVTGTVVFVELPDEEISMVELRISPDRLEDFRQTKVFEGAGQRLFAVMSWTIADGEGGSEQVECWDSRTTMVIPKLPRVRVVKLLLKPGLQWSLWDTGLRV